MEKWPSIIILGQTALLGHILEKYICVKVDVINKFYANIENISRDSQYK